MSRRIALTGLGAVTPVGIGVKAFWESLREGVPGIDTITRFDPSPFPCKIAAEVRDFDPRDFMAAKRAAVTTRFVQLGVAAARMAYEDAGLATSPRASRFWVCCTSSASAVPELQGTIEEFVQGGMRRVSPSVMLEAIGHAATNHAAVELGLHGRTMTLASGCASALDAMQWAAEQIRSRQATGVLVGASDAPLSTSLLSAWCAMNLVSRWSGPPAQALRPFDALMDGLVIGEGAGAYVLEDLEHARARGARIYGELLGYGMGTDGLHVPGVDPTGMSTQNAIRGALRAARLEPSEIDYIDSHGSGSPEHDRAETAAYHAAFGRHAYGIPVSSIKPMIGQSFAAAGALQVIAGCFTLEEQYVPPTLNHDIPDAACDLDYVPWRGRHARVNRLLVTTRTLGPTYSAVVLGRVPGG